MLKNLLFLCFIGSLFHGFAQTRITLEDQCNCKVLHGDDVNASGETTPTGAETGDLYVNTQTAKLFFWDGDSWELFNSPNAANGPISIANASLDFDMASGILSLDLGDGQLITTSLSELEGSGTDDQVANEVPYDNTRTGLNATNVQDAIDEVSESRTILPSIYATGKVAANGLPVIIHGSTVTRINEGDYQILFHKPVSNDYVIQVSVLDCGGDCPGNTSDPYDSPSITYYDQNAFGFKVNIGDSDNGANPKDDIDLEFMFTTIVFPLFTN